MFIRVKTFPNSKREEVVDKGADRFYVYVREKAEEGRANEKMLEILAAYLKIDAKKLVITRGSKTPNKTIKRLT
jgi:uncharacterized protein YggU (UPF0235/DUF167 family)